MRTISLKSSGIFFFLASVLAVSILFSCNKDEDDNDDLNDKTAFIYDYFDVVGGDFVQKDMPGANSDNLDILGLSGNQTILPGGSNPINVETGNSAKSILIGVSGVNGYFNLPVGTENNQNGNRETTVTILLGQGLNQDLSIKFMASDGNGSFGYPEILDVNYMYAGTGLLQISLSWDQENDVDLHLIEPNGEEIFYGHSYSGNGGQLDVDSNPACNLDYINNENIFDEDITQIESGEYEVLVDLWANCGIEENTNYNIVAYYDGMLISPTEGFNPHTSYLEPEDESQNSNPISIMKFEIPNGSTSRPANVNSNTPKIFQFKFKKQKEKSLVLSPNKI